MVGPGGRTEASWVCGECGDRQPCAGSDPLPGGCGEPPPQAPSVMVILKQEKVPPEEKPQASAAQRYKELMSDLLLRRDSAGGDLAEEEEVRFGEALDACWREMSGAEQAEIEEILSLRHEEVR